MIEFHVVYKLLDPRDEAVRYVGVTKGGLWKRTNTTLSGLGGKSLQMWVCGLRHLGKIPLAYEIETVPDCDRDAAERAWIAAHLALGDDLLNATDGGKNGKAIVPRLLDADRALYAEYEAEGPHAERNYAKGRRT